MNFGAAIAAMQQGMKVRRDNWPSHRCVFLAPHTPAGPVFYRTGIEGNPGAVPWLPTPRAMLADNWMVCRTGMRRAESTPLAGVCVE